MFFGSLLLLVVLGITAKVLDPAPNGSGWLRVIGIVLVVIFVLSLPLLFYYAKVVHKGQAARWSRRAGWAARDDHTEATTVVRLAAAALNETAAANPRFPGRLLCDATLVRSPGSARIAVPPVFTPARGRHSSMTVYLYVWVRLPRALPGLILTRDLTPGSARHVSDVNIENDRFNRHFRVRQWSPEVTGRWKMPSPTFQRYGSALLTPRIAEELLAVGGRQVAVLIRDDLLMAITVPRPDFGEQVADALLRIAALIPRFVFDDYGR